MLCGYACCMQAHNQCNQLSQTTLSLQCKPCTHYVPPICPPSLQHRFTTLHLLPACVPDAMDGSLQRSQWHGWGDVSLLKQEGYEGEYNCQKGGGGL